MNSEKRSASRREFLKKTGRVAAVSALAGVAVPRVHAAENNTIKLALIGCGSRGTGAAVNALSTKDPTKLWAMADVFDDRLQTSHQLLSKQFGKQVNVPRERQFIGMDAYRKALDAIGPGGVALLTTPPGFRPIHLEHAVAKGCHVFMEKSFGVDAPGVCRVLKAGEEATKKNLKVAGGLMSRHYRPLEEAIHRIHDGAIGDVIAMYTYRQHNYGNKVWPTPGANELAHQIRNYHSFTWIEGGFILDWMIHDIDVCCWAKNAWPISAQGQGGRQAGTEPDQIFDHFSVEYTFADGTRLMAQGRIVAGCWTCCGNLFQGATGCGVGSGWCQQPLLYKGHNQTHANLLWQYKGPPCDDYQYEQDLLFDAIRRDKPYNEAERCAKAAMTGILGRMVAESGQMITWDEAIASKIELAPGLDQLTMNLNAPVMPDAQGHYPIPVPGVTKVL